MLRTVIRGVSEAQGSWQTICARRRVRRVRSRRRDRQLRDLVFDLLEHSYVADLAPPVCVDEPPTRLRAPAARLVIGLGVGNGLELGLLLPAHLAAVLAARLEAAARRR